MLQWMCSCLSLGFIIPLALPARVLLSSSGQFPPVLLFSSRSCWEPAWPLSLPSQISGRGSLLTDPVHLAFRPAVLTFNVDCYLCQGGHVTAALCLFVRKIPYEWISMTFSGTVDNGPRKR